MHQPSKYCPECGSEYLIRAQRCADCDVPLQWTPPSGVPGTGASRAGNGDAPIASGLPPIGEDEEIVLLRTAEVTWIRELAAGLERHRIPCIVVPATEENEDGAARPVRRGWDFVFHCFVRQDDLDEARRIDGRIEHAHLPALAETPYLEIEGENCPACGDPLPEEADECPGCGLVFRSEDVEPGDEDDAVEKKGPP